MSTFIEVLASYSITDKVTPTLETEEQAGELLKETILLANTIFKRKYRIRAKYW